MDAKDAAEDIYQDRLNILGERKNLSIQSATEQADFNLQSSLIQSDYALEGLNQNLNIQSTQIGNVRAKSGLATSGTIDAKSEDLLSKVNTDMKRLFDTRNLENRKRDFQVRTAKSEADLAYRTGEISAEEAYQDTLTQLDATPDNFLEGFFS